MSMTSGTNFPSAGGPPGRSRLGTYLLVGLMAVVLFGAGVGISLLLRGGGGTSTPDANAQSPGPTCVTTTAVPSATLPKPATVSINVFNATDRRGLAASTAATLKARGFTVGTIANDPLGKKVTAPVQLRFGETGKDNAALLAFYIDGAQLVPDARTDASVDVVLGSKFKLVQSAAAVKVAMNKPKETVTGTGCGPAPAGSAKPAGSASAG